MKPKRKYLPPHSDEPWPVTHGGQANKSLIIAAITIGALVVLTLLLFFSNQFVGKVIATPNTIGFYVDNTSIETGNLFTVQIKAHIGAKKTVAAGFEFDLPKGIECKHVGTWDSKNPANSNINLTLPGWGVGAQGYSAYREAGCSNNKIKVDDSVLLSQLAVGNGKEFTIANITFKGVPKGTYKFDKFSREEIIEYPAHTKIGGLTVKDVTVTVADKVKPAKKCPTDAPGTYPNCVCKNKGTFDQKTGLCSTPKNPPTNKGIKFTCPSQVLVSEKVVCSLEFDPAAVQLAAMQWSYSIPSYIGVNDTKIGPSITNIDSKLTGYLGIAGKDVKGRYGRTFNAPQGKAAKNVTKVMDIVFEGPHKIGNGGKISLVDVEAYTDALRTNKITLATTIESNVINVVSKKDSVESTKIKIENLKPTQQGQKWILRTKITAKDNLPAFDLIIQIKDKAVNGKTLRYDKRTITGMKNKDEKIIETIVDSLGNKKSVIAYDAKDTLGVKELVTDIKQ